MATKSYAICSLFSKSGGFQRVKSHKDWQPRCYGDKAVSWKALLRESQFTLGSGLPPRFVINRILGIREFERRAHNHLPTGTSQTELLDQSFLHWTKWWHMDLHEWRAGGSDFPFLWKWLFVWLRFLKGWRLNHSTEAMSLVLEAWRTLDHLCVTKLHFWIA